MLLFFAQADLVNRPGEKGLLEVAFDRDQYAAVDRSQIAPHVAVWVDESTLDNQSRCVDFYNRRGQRDFRGLAKYYGKYRDAALQLWERGGWRPAPETYDPAQFPDIQLVLARSPERAGLQDSYAGMVARLQQIRQNPPANLQQLFLGVQDVAVYLEMVLGLQRRLEKPD